MIGAREGSILLLVILVILGWYYGLFMDFRSSAILVIVFVYDLYGQVRLYGPVRFTEECYIGDAGQGGRGRRAAEQQSMQESGAAAAAGQESMAAAEVMQLVTHSQLDIRESQRGSNGRGGCSSLETSLLATSLTP